MFKRLSFSLLFFIIFMEIVRPAAHSTGSFNYYSIENLRRMQEENAGLRARQEMPRQRHAPLMIAFDNCEIMLEAPSASSENILRRVSSDFCPVIVQNVTLFEAALRFLGTELVSALKEKYVVYDVRGAEIIVLVPHWYADAYGDDHGLNLGAFVDRTSSLADLSALQAWIEIKKKNQRAAKDSEELFEAGLRSVFLNKQSGKAPCWDIIFFGHGSAEHSICGFGREIFASILHYFNKELSVGCVYLLSCHVGGVNSHYLNEAINSWDDSLCYELILATTGDAVYTQSIYDSYKDFFLKAACISRQASDSLVLKDLMQSFLSKYSYVHPEHIPQMRTRASDTFAFSDDADSRIAVLGNNNEDSPCGRAIENIHIVLITDPNPVAGITLKTVFNDTHARMLDTTRLMLEASDQEKKTLALRNLVEVTRAVMREECMHQASLSSFIDLGSSTHQRYPTFIISLPQKELATPVCVKFSQIELVEEDCFLGVHKFFVDSFTSAYFVNERKICIDTLIGANDISFFCYLFKKENPGEFEESSGAFDTENHDLGPITLKNVCISLSRENVNIDFAWDNRRYQLGFAGGGMPRCDDQGIPTGQQCYFYSLERVYAEITE